MNANPNTGRTSLTNSDILKLKNFLSERLLRELGSEILSKDQQAELVTQKLQEVYSLTNLNLPDALREQVFAVVRNEVLGYGPIQPLLEDPDVNEIMVNGPKDVYIEKNGQLIKTSTVFENDAHVIQIIDRIILPMGRRIDADSPTVDARLPDGSRVNAVIPPVSIDGPAITIRKFSNDKLKIEDLIQIKSLTEHMASFLKACVVSRLNIIISGGTGSGKTTLLNALSAFIPEKERIITIEDAAELQLQQDHVLRMETKNPNLDGYGEVTVRDLVRNALRMRPDRIVVGECRGGEALDMLQAMNTGHDGSLTTVHANSPRDALSRLETLTLMSGMDLPLKVIRQQIASAVDVVVQQSRLNDGTRKVTSITEVSGMEGETIIMTDIFKYQQTAVDQGGKIMGELKPTGMRPMFTSRLEASGFKLGPEVFGAKMTQSLNHERRRR